MTSLDQQPTTEHDHAPLSQEAKDNLINFLECVRDIVKRLLSEGYTIVDGKLVPPPGYEDKTKPRTQRKRRGSTLTE
jgi:hypothetical protein